MEKENDNVETETQTKKKNKNILIIIAICAIVIIVIAVVFGLLSRDESDVNDEVYSTYETVSSESLRFEVQKFYNKDVLYVWNDDYTSYKTYETDNNFLVITLRVTNAGSKKIDFKTSYVKLLSPDYTYRLHELNDTIVGGINTDTTLQPSLSKEFKLVFETPQDSTQIDYMLYVRGGENATWQRIWIKGEGTGGYY